MIIPREYSDEDSVSSADIWNNKYRDMYLYSERNRSNYHIQRRYKDTVVVSIVLSILGTWATLYGLYYKIYER